MKRNICCKSMLITMMGLLAALFLTSCSVVYSSYISGKVSDEDLNNPAYSEGGIEPEYVGFEMSLYGDCVKRQDLQVYDAL